MVKGKSTLNISIEALYTPVELIEMIYDKRICFLVLQNVKQEQKH